MKRILAASALAMASAAMAQAISPSEYSGQGSRALKALSDVEVQDYLAGKGMGMSKVAELNSRPGPAHVLQLATEMQLSAAQLEEVRQLHRQMQADAIALGKELVQKEAALQNAVTRKTPSEAEVARLIADAADTQGRLRAAHVLAHLKTAAILTPEQIARYDMLRGYATGHHGGVHPGTGQPADRLHHHH